MLKEFVSTSELRSLLNSAEWTDVRSDFEGNYVTLVFEWEGSYWMAEFLMDKNGNLKIGGRFEATEVELKTVTRWVTKEPDPAQTFGKWPGSETDEEVQRLLKDDT